MADFPPDDIASGPPPDLISPPDDLIGGGATLQSQQPQSSGLGAFGRHVERGVAPAAGGLTAGVMGAGLGAGLGAMTGPAAPVLAPVGGFLGGLGGAYFGGQAVDEAQDWLLSKLPESVQKAMGLDKAQQQADESQHPYTSMAGELAPNLALLRPGKIATQIPKDAGIVRRAMQSPATARLAGATLMAGQEAGTEKYQTGQIDPTKVAMAAGAGALMNRPTKLGEGVIGAASAPQRVLTNIARGRPANAPDDDGGGGGGSGGPPADLVDAPQGATAATPPPSAAPAQGEAIGVRFKSGPPQRAVVEHYFDKGNAVRLRMDDGSVQDLTTQDMLQSRTEAPEPMPPQPNRRPGGPELDRDERPTPPFDLEDEAPPAARRAPVNGQQPVLGGDMLNALDHADALERTALNQSLQLSAGARQDMLTEAARLRRLNGQQDDTGAPPNQYRHPDAGQERIGALPVGQGGDYAHPLSGEPAADLGALAAARVAKPDLYQPGQADDAGRTVPEAPETFQAQQAQLLAGQRPAMLFPRQAEGQGTELPLPPGMARAVTKDGVFHFDPAKTSAEAIAEASKAGTLNQLLALGPYSKAEVMRRVQAGEQPLAVTERTPDGLEVRTAAGTDQTAPEQRAFFEQSKTPGNTVAIEDPQAVIEGRVQANKTDPYAIEDVLRARAPMPKEASLFDAIRSLGGIKDGRGDVAQIMKDFKNPRFVRRVVNPDGLPPDRVREILQEQGWFGHHEDRFGPAALETGSYPGDSLTDLYDLMDQEARGQKVYHPDSNIHSTLAERESLEREFGEAGIQDSDSTELAARKLQRYRAQRNAEQRAYDQSRAIHDELSSIPDEDLRGLLGDEVRPAETDYEPGSDLGAEYEERGGPEGSLEPPEDLVPVEDENPPGYAQAAGRGEGAPESDLEQRQDVRPSLNAEPGAEGFDQTILPGTEKGTAGTPESANRTRAQEEMRLRQQQSKIRRGDQESVSSQEGGLFGQDRDQGDIFGGLKQPDDALKSPPFYSALTRGVEGLKMEKAPPGQWEATIKNLPAIKQEELDWSGLKEWLGQQARPVTKAEVLEHLRGNEVQVQEVPKGPPQLGAGTEEMRALDSELQDFVRKNALPDTGEGDRSLTAKDLHGILREEGAYKTEAGQAQMSWLADFMRRETAARQKYDLSGAKPQPTKFGSYVLPGGENYRELLLTLPEKAPELPDGYTVKPFQDGWAVFGPNGADEIGWAPTRGGALANAQPHLSRLGSPSPTYRSGHWDEPNILAHVRFDDRTGPNGEKVLHIAEVQSDWHQKGRRHGYVGDGLPEKDLAKSHEYAPGKWQVVNGHDDILSKGPYSAEQADAIAAAQNSAARANQKSLGVPEAPFKSSWHEVAMKRMLRYAAENGYDRLSWDTGETQNARYDLSKQIDSIDWHKTADGKFLIYADKNGQTVLQKDRLSPADLADTIGKDAADKIIAASEKKDGGKLSNIDLKIGGEGMKGFYDRILPNFLNKYAKKWGAKVESSSTETNDQGWHITPPDQTVSGRWMVKNSDYNSKGLQFDTEADAKAALATLKASSTLAYPSHSIPITDAMREGVLGGQALFQPTDWGDPARETEPANGPITDLRQDFSDFAHAHGGDIPSALRDFLIDRGRRTNTEALGFHDLETDAVPHVATQNLPKQVAFSPGLVNALRDPNTNAIGHHNHPSARSLSEGDLGALAYPGMRAIVAHGHDGNWFGARLTPEGRAHIAKVREERGFAGARQELINASTLATQRLKPDFQTAINDGRITREEGNDALHHVVNTVLAHQGLVEYISSKELPPHVAEIANNAAARVARDYRAAEPVRYEDGIARLSGAPERPSAARPDADEDEGTGGSRSGGLEQPDGHFPQSVVEAADRRDSAADDLAEQLRNAPPGTYARTLHKMSPPSGDLIFKDPNAVQNVTLRPETMARLDTRSAAIWNAEKAKEYDANAMVDDLRQRISGTMLKLDDQSRSKVYAARELDRINGMVRTDTGHRIVARNEGADFAHFSKPGDVVTLSPQETAAYHALSDMFDRSWKNVMEGAARKVGWDRDWNKQDMAANLEAMKEVAEHSADQGSAKVAARALKIVSALDGHRRQGYHPLMRFGDYFAHVTPKIGTDETSTGGFPKTARFELAERGLKDEVIGGSRAGNQAPPYAKEMLDRLEAQYPADKYNIEHGYLAKNPDMLDRVDIPAIEKLMTFMENDMLHSLRVEGRGKGMTKGDASEYARQKYDDLYGRLVDQLWEKTFKELEAGFKKRSNTVPGYSGDFDRALGTYMHWTSRNVADQIHRGTVDEAHTAMETDPRVNPAVKRYWRNWRDYQQSPSNIFNKGVNGMARWGFLTAMGVNPSSTAVVGAHGLFMAGPTLSVGVGMGKAAPAYAQAMNHAMSAIKVGSDGLTIPDVGKAGRTPQEKAFLAQLDKEGLLHSRAIEDMAALNEKQSTLWGSARSTARKIMDMALSNVSVMDRANRIASALSSYRLASDPATLARMDAAWKSNQIWRERAEREGANPQSMARFMVPNMVGEYGKANQAPLERNAAARMMLGMHGFVTRLLQNMWKLGSMGPEGQKALLWTMGAFWTMAGLDGTPFAQDVQNFGDLVWKAATGKDPMIGYRIQSELAGIFGKPGADMILHGPVSALSGMDIGSRLGMGDLISRNWPTAENTLGAYPSIILGRVMAAASDYRSGQHEAAAAQFLPGGLRNAAMAAIERQKGIKTRAGRVTVPQTKIEPVDTTSRILGFTPEKAERAYERADFGYRAQRSKMRPPPNPVPFADGGRVKAAAKEADRQPSQAQIEAGNYRMGHVSLHGFDISIETPKGAARRGVGADGKAWENRHPTAHYGYIRRSIGADSEHVDAYIGAYPESRRIFIVDQFDPKTRRFDEHKIVFGARTIKEAKLVYDGGFSDASGPSRRRHVHEVSPQTLRAWIDEGAVKRPYAQAA